MAQNSMAQQFLFAGQQYTQLENHDSPLGTSTSNADQHARNVQLFAQLQKQFSEQGQQQDADGIPQHQQQAPQPFPADLQELAAGAQNGNTQPTPSLNIDLDCQPPNQSYLVSTPQSSVFSIDSDALEDSQSAGSPQLSDQSAVNSTAQGVQQQQHQAPAPWRSSSPTPRHLNQHHHIPFFSGEEKQPPNIPSNPSEEQALLAANKPQAGGERGAFAKYFREAYRVWLENKGLPYPQDRIIEGKTVSLVQLFLMVGAFGGHKAVTDQALWQVIGAQIGFPNLAAQGGQPQKATPEVAQTIMGIYSTFLSEFEVHWYNALRRGDPGSPFPLPPNLQYLRPQIANLVNATFGVDSTPQQQISSQANEGPSHPNPVIGQQNAPILQPQQQQQIVRMALQLLQSHPQLRGLAPQELITMSADDWRQRGWNEQEIKLLEIARPHILAFPQQQQQSSQEQAPVYPTQARLLEMQRLQKLVRAQAQAQAQAHAQAQAQAPQNHEPLLSQTPTPQLSNMPQPQPGEVGMPQGLDQAQDIPHGPLGVQPITPAANSHAQQLVHPLEPPHQTQQQPNIQPNPFSDPLPDLSHLQAWPSLDQLAQADAHIQRLLREAVRQLELERPVPTYDIAEDLLYNEKFQYIGTIAPHLKQCLVPLYVFAPKEKNALKVAICDLVKVMEQQRLMKAGQKVYLFTPQELDMISAQWKKLLTYHEHVLRAAEKLPGFPQTPQQQQQQPMLPSATMLHPSTQPQLPLGTPSVPQHPNVGVEQPVAHDNTRFAPVGQHPSPPADSLPSVEQSRLQPSANDVASPPSPALETPASPIEGSITTIATSPKTPNSPLVASETPKGEPDEDALRDDIQMAPNVDSLPQNNGVDQASTKLECEDCRRYMEDCERYKEQLLYKEIQNRALTDQVNLLLQERRKGVQLLPRLFSSRTKVNSTAFASSEICESRPEYRGKTVYLSAEDIDTRAGRCCVIQ